MNHGYFIYNLVDELPKTSLLVLCFNRFESVVFVDEAKWLQLGSVVRRRLSRKKKCGEPRVHLLVISSVKIGIIHLGR